MTTAFVINFLMVLLKATTTKHEKIKCTSNQSFSLLSRFYLQQKQTVTQNKTYKHKQTLSNTFKKNGKFSKKK